MQRRDFFNTSLAGLPLLRQGINPPASSYKVLFVTDMHLTPAIDQSKRAADYLVDYIEAHPDIKFIINGGDTIYDVAKLKYPEGEEQWQYWKTVYARINRPVYNCLGNHDIYEWERSTDEIANPQQCKEPALQHLGMPGRYYSFGTGKWKFLVLDSNWYVPKGYKGQLDEQQIKWLAEELTKDKDLHLCIISHIPVITACDTLYLPAEKNSLYPKIAERLFHNDAALIFEEMSKRPPKLMLHGHLHMQEIIQYKETTICNGGAFCGDLWKGPFHGFKPCFTILEFFEDGKTGIERIDLLPNEKGLP